MVKLIEVELLHETYADLYDIIGNEQMLLQIHALMGGQQVNLPEHLYSKEKVKAQMMELENEKRKDINLLAKKYGYSRVWIRKFLKEYFS